MHRILPFLFVVAMAGSAASVLAAPKQRQCQYTQRPQDQAVVWQGQVREKLSKLLQLDDLLHANIPFDAQVLSTKKLAGHELKELQIHSTAARRIRVVLGIPKAEVGPFPAVVCIHGHGGSRYSPYEPKTIYKAFGTALADRGFVTISTDVGQHEVYEENRTLMGERLWDVMRCVDYVTSLTEVDAARVGCGGLSLGGEMAMWLGAIDERIAATISCGFLTVMDQMEQNHCMCWKFPGLRDLVDYADIYSLIAPRPLQCQNGLKEGPNDFYVPIAQEAIQEVRLIYTDFGTPEKVALRVHPGAHEIDLPALLAFFQTHLRP